MKWTGSLLAVWDQNSLSFDIKLRGDCGSFCFFQIRMRFLFEMQRTKSCCLYVVSSVWTQIIWTFDIKLAEISAKIRVCFLCLLLFCRIWFGGNEIVNSFHAVWDQNILSIDVKLREIVDHFVSSKCKRDFWLWNAKLFGLVSRQFGLRSFGHLISNLRRFSANKSLFFVFVLFCQVWFWGNEIPIPVIAVWDQNILSIDVKLREIVDHFVSSKCKRDFWLWNAKLFGLVSRQFGLRSFGHLISNLRRFSANKSLFFVFVLFCQVWFWGNEIPIPVIAVWDQNILSIDVKLRGDCWSFWFFQFRKRFWFGNAENGSLRLDDGNLEKKLERARKVRICLPNQKRGVFFLQKHIYFEYTEREQKLNSFLVTSEWMHKKKGFCSFPVL